MRTVIAVAVTLACASAFVEAKSAHAKLLEIYDEPDSWKNHSNFYVGGRAGVAVPPGATSLAPTVGLEVGVAPDVGFGLGLHTIWMNNPPGAPVFGIQPGRYGFGTMVDLRFNIPTIDPLTLYPTVSAGFLAGPGLDGKNMVLPLINLGVGAKVRFGDFYGSFEFGFAGFSIPFLTLGFGYQGDRRKQRAEAWALEEEQTAREQGVPVDLKPRHREPVAPPAENPEVSDDAPPPTPAVPAEGSPPRPAVKPATQVLKAKLTWGWSRGVIVHNQGSFNLHGCQVRLPNGRVGRFDPEDQIDAGDSDNIRDSNLETDPLELDQYMKQGYALVRCKEVSGYVWWGKQPG